jgi:DNA-binding MarR family transcriptional regulator
MAEQGNVAERRRMAKQRRLTEQRRMAEQGRVAKQGNPTVEDVIAVAEFRSALRQYLRRSERVARRAGLTPQRYLLLMMIKGAPAGNQQSTVTELSERLQLAQSTVTELVRRAEAAGLVERERSSDDARVAHLRLTPEGERRLGASFTELETERAHLREAFATLDGGLSGRKGRRARR